MFVSGVITLHCIKTEAEWWDGVSENCTYKYCATITPRMVVKVVVVMRIVLNILSGGNVGL